VGRRGRGRWRPQGNEWGDVPVGKEVNQMRGAGGIKGRDWRSLGSEVLCDQPSFIRKFMLVIIF